MGGGEVPDDLMSTWVTMALAAVLLFLTACVRWYLWGSGSENFTRVHYFSCMSKKKTVVVFKRPIQSGGEQSTK